MTTIVSWNIQYGKGVDGKVDLARIASRTRSANLVDVACFQEVVVGFPEYDGVGADQPAELARLFPGYEPVFRPAVDWYDGGRRRQFGNMILSRHKVLEVQSHVLPRPAERVPHMPRQALEVIVEAPFGPLRVVTTHLEFHSQRQRAAQVSRICELEEEWAAAKATPPAKGKGSYARRPVPVGSVWCGDFNFPIDEPTYRQMLTSGLIDPWPQVRPGMPHPPTCGVFDAQQWPQGPHARDFFYIAPALAARVSELFVDTECNYSDHQPLRLTLLDQ